MSRRFSYGSGIEVRSGDPLPPILDKLIWQSDAVVLTCVSTAKHKRRVILNHTKYMIMVQTYRVLATLSSRSRTMLSNSTFIRPEEQAPIRIAISGDMASEKVVRTSSRVSMIS